MKTGTFSLAYNFQVFCERLPKSVARRHNDKAMNIIRMVLYGYRKCQKHCTYCNLISKTSLFTICSLTFHTDNMKVSVA